MGVSCGKRVFGVSMAYPHGAWHRLAVHQLGDFPVATAMGLPSPLSVLEPGGGSRPAAGFRYPRIHPAPGAAGPAGPLKRSNE